MVVAHQMRLIMEAAVAAVLPEQEQMGLEQLVEMVEQQLHLLFLALQLLILVVAVDQRTLEEPLV